MKKLAMIMGLTLATSSFAATNLVCNDQNSHAVYSLSVSSEAVVLRPLIADSSVLSQSEAKLKYNEGEDLFEGSNKSGSKLALIINQSTLELLKKNQIVEAKLYFSKSSSSKLDGKTDFLCSLN